MLACKRSLSGTVTSALRALRTNPVKTTSVVFYFRLRSSGAELFTDRCSSPPPQVAACSPVHRPLSTQTDGEIRIANILKEKFPSASSLKVVDISGGCGAMYEIHIESSEFKGKRTVQQHQLVNQVNPNIISTECFLWH
uniref:BolA family member 3 n=1 Tax=Lates calcarifer TaxID=8187 RepID=A0A4W6G1Z0_LATCA